MNGDEIEKEFKHYKLFQIRRIIIIKRTWTNLKTIN
jgi:hypothetical protein